MKKKFLSIARIIAVAAIAVLVGGCTAGSNTGQFKGPVPADEPMSKALISDISTSTQK